MRGPIWHMRGSWHMRELWFGVKLEKKKKKVFMDLIETMDAHSRLLYLKLKFIMDMIQINFVDYIKWLLDYGISVDLWVSIKASEEKTMHNRDLWVGVWIRVEITKRCLKFLFGIYFF